MNKPYYSFNTYLKERFNKKVYKICVDAGFTCPNRDGTKGINGCIYCNNDAFTIVRRDCIKEDRLSSEPAGSVNDRTNIPLPSLEQQIEQGKKKLAAHYKAEAFILYFQPYSNTYASLQKLKEAYDYVYYDNDIVGLSIGTRPDCVNEEILTFIEAYAKDKEVWIEYGLESSHNKTMQVINRGHTWEDFLEAVQMTSNRPIKICVHIIFGLPGESRADMLETVRRISRLPIHAVKFHPLHIVKGSVLYERGKLEDGIWKVELPE
ncbi:MAG: TIGR01212 family radical SAM protein, partial [Candidatus Fischerbacteria bacterium RBG_13_37_8]